MTDHNQRPVAVRLLFVAVAVVCFGQAYRIAAAVGGRAEAASVAQASAVSVANLPRYVEKPIEEIRVGDLVLARNDVTGELASKRVVRAFQRTSDHIRELTIRSSLGGLQTIETTDEHPFWVTGSGWVSAGQLSPGAALLDSEGGTATVVASVLVPRSDGVPVYNFEVDDWHTYHVKAGRVTGPPLLVHNNCVNPYHARAPGGGVFVDLDTSLAGRGGAPQSVHYDVGRVPGPNPNNLRQRVVTSPTAGEGGVYLKPQSGRTKIGSTNDFRGRYGANASDGIEVEVPLTRTGPATNDSAYRWSARRQLRFDEEYLDRITPSNVRYRDPSNPKSPVDPAKWEQYRQIFGYGDLPADFGF